MRLAVRTMGLDSDMCFRVQTGANLESLGAILAFARRSRFIYPAGGIDKIDPRMVQSEE